MSAHRLHSLLIGTVIACLCAAVLAMVGLTWFDYRAPPIRIDYAHPVPVAGPTVRREEIVEKPVATAGQGVWMYREYCVTAGYRVLRSERWLYKADDPNIAIPLPIIPIRALRAGDQCTRRATLNQLPDGVPPGKWLYRVEWDYTLAGNPIATFHFDWPDVLIEIRP